MKKMYLVTGAAGFLGGTVCRQLIDRGDNVRAFVLPNDPAMKFVPKEAEICESKFFVKRNEPAWLSGYIRLLYALE